MSYQTIEPVSVKQSDENRLWYNLATLVPQDTVYDNTTELVQTRSGYAECILNGFYYDENKPNSLTFDFGSTEITDTTNINNVRFYFRMYVIGDGRTNMVSQTPKPNVKLWTHLDPDRTYDWHDSDEYLKLVDEMDHNYYVDAEASYLNDNYDSGYTDFTVTFNNISMGNVLSSSFFNNGFGISLEFPPSKCMVEHRVIFESVYCVLNYGTDGGMTVTCDNEETYTVNTLNTIQFTIVEDTDVDSRISFEADGDGLYINPYNNVGVENGHPLSTDDPYKFAEVQTYGGNTVVVTLHFVPTKVGDCSFKVTVNEELTPRVFNFTVVGNDEDTYYPVYDFEENTLTFYGDFTSDTEAYVQDGTIRYKDVKSIKAEALLPNYIIVNGEQHSNDPNDFIFRVTVELWNNVDGTVNYDGHPISFTGSFTETLITETVSSDSVVVTTEDDEREIPIDLSTITKTGTYNNDTGAMTGATVFTESYQEVHSYTPSLNLYDSLLKIHNIGTTDAQGITTPLFSIGNVEVYRKYSSGNYRLLDPHFYSLSVSDGELLLKTFEGRYYDDGESPDSTIQDIKTYNKDYHDKVVVHITPLRNEYNFQLTSQGMSNTTQKTNTYYQLISPNKYTVGSVLNLLPATAYMQERTKVTIENFETGENDIIHYYAYIKDGVQINKSDALNEDGTLKEGVTFEEVTEDEAYITYYWFNNTAFSEEEVLTLISDFEDCTLGLDPSQYENLGTTNVRMMRLMRTTIIPKYESVLSLDFSKCHFILKKPQNDIRVELPVPYIGAVRLHRCHKADVTNTTTNSLIREVYQNRQYYGKKGDWEEKITMTLRMPWQDIVTLQGHTRADMPIPIDINPLHPDGDPLNHRGWAEISSTGEITKINDMLYQCKPEVTYLTHELIGRFAITQDPDRICNQDPPINMLKTHEYWEDDREVLDLSSYLNFHNMPIGDGMFKGVYTVADDNEYVFDLKGTVSSIGRYNWRWRNILPALGTTAHDDNRWQTAIRVLGASDDSLLFEYLYKDFKHYDGDNLLNESDVRVLHKNPVTGLLDTIDYTHMNLDFDEVGAEVSIDKTNTYIEIPKQDQTLFEKGRNLYFTLRDSRGYGIPNKDVDVNIINNHDEVIYSIPALTDVNGNRDVELNLESGDYTAQLLFSGDDKYNPCSIEYYFTVDLVYRQGTELAIYNEYGGYGYDINNEYIEGRLLTDDDRPIAGEKVYVSIYQYTPTTLKVNGKRKTFNFKTTISSEVECTTSARGWFKAKVNLLGVQAGTFTAEAVYKGTDYYQKNSYSRTFTMHQWYKHKTSITTSDQKYEQGKEYNFVATLKDHKGKPIKGETLRFGIHNYQTGINQRFAIKTDKNGQAKIPVMFNSGNHQIDTYYNGSSRYEYSPARNTNKITTYAKGKETTTITAYMMHIVDYVNDEYNAWLKDSSGKGIPNVPITFEIYEFIRSSEKADADGTYSGKKGALKERGQRLTDASGQAEWNINLPTGDYMGYAYYEGDNKYAPSSRGRAILISRPPTTHNLDITFPQASGGTIQVTRDEQTGDLSPIIIQLTATPKSGGASINPKGIDGKITYTNLSTGKQYDGSLVNTTITSDANGQITIYPTLEKGNYRMNIETYGASIDKNHDGVFETVFAGKESSVQLNVTNDCYMDTLIDVVEANDNVVDVRKDSSEPIRILLKGIDEATGEPFLIPNKRVSVQYAYTYNNKTITSSKEYFTTDENGLINYTRKIGYTGTLTISYSGDIGYDSCLKTITVSVHDKSQYIPHFSYKMNTDTIRYEALPLNIRSFYKNGDTKYPTSNTRVRIQVTHSNPLVYNKSFTRYTDGNGYIDINLVFPENGKYTINLYAIKEVDNVTSEVLVKTLPTVNVDGANKGTDTEPVEYLPNKLPTTLEFVSPDKSVGGLVKEPIQHTVTRFPYLLKAKVSYFDEGVKRVLPNHRCRIYFTLTNGVIEEYQRYTDTDGIMTYESLPLSYGEYPVTIEVETDDTYATSNINTVLIVTEEAEKSFDSPSPAKAHLQKKKGQVTPLETPLVETYDGIEYGSTAEMTFNGNLLDFQDYGLTQNTSLVGAKISLTDIELPKDEKGYKLQFLTRYNNDVDNTVDELLGTLQVEITDDKISKLYQQFYENLVVSPAPLYNHKLMFTREAEDGTLYYYDVTSNIDVKRYRLSPFLQYKGGVNLETASGVSIFDLETGVSPVIINNGLIKAEFNKRSGFVRVARYDDRTKTWNWVRWLQVEENFYKMELLHYSTDKISLKMGNTTWTVWRGRPWIEIKHEDDDIRIIGETNKTYAEILHNDTRYQIMSEVDTHNGIFNTYNAINYFGKELNITENIKRDNFTITGATASTPIDISLIGETCLKVDANSDEYHIKLPQVQRPSDDIFTFLIDRLKMDNVDNIKITCNAYDTKGGEFVASAYKEFDVETTGDETVTDLVSDGRLNTGFRSVFDLSDFKDKDNNSIKETTYWHNNEQVSKEDAYVTIIDEEDGTTYTELKENIEIKETFGAKYEKCNFLEFDIELHKTVSSNNSYAIINHLMLSDGDNRLGYMVDNRLDGISNQAIAFTNTFYTNFYNSFESFGLCVLRPYRDQIYLHKLPKSKCTVLIPYNRFCKKYDSPSYVCLEYVFTHNQTTSLIGDEY